MKVGDWVIYGNPDAPRAGHTKPAYIGERARVTHVSGSFITVEFEDGTRHGPPPKFYRLIELDGPW